MYKKEKLNNEYLKSKYFTRNSSIDKFTSTTHFFPITHKISVSTRI